jgi:multiple sugar transport system substrate-binding protein
MKARYAAIFLLLLAAVLVLSSCSRQSPHKNRVVIRYLNWEGSVEQIKLMEQMVAQFNRTSPDTEVVLDSSAGIQKLLVQLAGDAGPDCFYYCDIGALANKKAIEPLEPYIKKYKYSLKEDFPCTVDAMTFDGKVYGLPLNLSTQCVVYNKDIFDKSGVPYPKAGWTWDDYLSAAKALTKVGDRGRVEQFGSLSVGFSDVLYANGGRIAHQENGAWKIDLPSPEALEAASFVLGVSKFSPQLSDKQVYGENLGQLFLMGKVAMFNCPTAGLVGFARHVKFKWDVVPIPNPPGKKALSLVGVGGMCMNARSKHKDAAFKFMMFYCSPAGQRILAEGRNCLPSKMEVAKTTFLEGLPEGASSYVDMALGKTVSYAKDLRGHSDEVHLQAITPYVEEMLYGKKTPEEALKAMGRETREILVGSSAKP